MNMLRWMCALGPGLIFAGAAIGVSHLVQSTRAGAEFGVAAAIAIVLAGILKYPFFEFGGRYAASTGKSFLEAYQEQLGALFPLFFIAYTLFAVFTCAAVTLVTAGLFGLLVGSVVDSYWHVVSVVAICWVLLMLGKYSLLDRAMKILVSTMALLTLSSVMLLLFSPSPLGGMSPAGKLLLIEFDLYTIPNMAFLLALMGWMPAPVDVAILNSFWTLEKKRNQSLSLAVVQKDFQLGYVLTMFLALVFLMLGTLGLYQSGATIPEGSVAFAGLLVQLYKNSLGTWSSEFIKILAFATMLSTTLAVLDGYPRMIAESWQRIRRRSVDSPPLMTTLSVFCLVVLSTLLFLKGQMRTLVDIVTITAFACAPVFALIQLRAVTAPRFAHRPTKFLLYLSYAGLFFLVLFSGIFLFSKLSS